MISPYSSWSLFALALITLQWLCSHNTCLHTASDLSIHVAVSPLRTYTWHLLRKPKYPTGPSNSLSAHFDASDLSILLLVLIPPLRTYTNISRLKLKKPTESWGSVFSVRINTENKSSKFFSYSFLMSPYLFWFLLWEMLSNTSCVKPKKPSEPWGCTFTDMSCIDPKRQQAFHCPYRSHSIITMMFPYCLWYFHTLTTPYSFWYLLWELIADTSCLKPPKKPIELWGPTFTINVYIENQSLTMLTMILLYSYRILGFDLSIVI